MKVFNLSNLLLCISLLPLLQTPAFAAKKSYVVYLGCHSHGPNPTTFHMQQATDSHHEFLGSFLGSKEEAKESIFHSYNKHINGFAAMFDEDLAKEIKKHPSVISIFENKLIQFHTTNSWEYLGLRKPGGDVSMDSLLKKASFGEDMIIANIDSGITPEYESFNDQGYGPIPSKWRGTCNPGEDPSFKCNRKLIGAKHFDQGVKQILKDTNQTVPEKFFSPRDDIGHGTHTLATAGGNCVPNISINGNGKGIMMGGASRARVVAYKAGWVLPNGQTGSDSADVIAAFEAAISDGVDVISASIGYTAMEYFEDAIAIGSFHAIMKDIIVVASAGNSGPDSKTLENEAPWMISVGASTTNREFLSDVKLGNGMQFQGGSLSGGGLAVDQLYPMVDGQSLMLPNATKEEAMECIAGSYDLEKTTGKVLVCTAVQPGRQVNKGIGFMEAPQPNMPQPIVPAPGTPLKPYVARIIKNDKETNNFFRLSDLPKPYSNINFTDGEALTAYMKSTPNPVATVGQSKTEFNRKANPMVAQFSSRGPSYVQPTIMKPDVVAPGVDIIAPFGGIPNLQIKATSGTSMSAPHVAGVYALLKKLHPDWSPSAIKSAIMTTASHLDQDNKLLIDQATNQVATPLHYGSGQISPNRAADPGLVYDITVDDYLNFLCGHGYNETTVSMFHASKTFVCPKVYNVMDFNYPAIVVPKLTDPLTVTRKVKNVGPPGTYKVSVTEPAGVSVVVEPASLTFGHVSEEKTFTVKITRKDAAAKGVVFGGFSWTDGVHSVCCPVSVME